MSPEGVPPEDAGSETEELPFFENLQCEREGKFFKAGWSTEQKEHSLRENPTNEDSLLVEDGIFGVFDGMGGHAAGHIASMTARLAVMDYLHDLNHDDPLNIQIGVVREALRLADVAIRRAVMENPEYKGMGTTGSVVVLARTPEGLKAIVGNVGDSRICILRKGGALEHLTLDDLRIYQGLDQAVAMRLQEKAANIDDLDAVPEISMYSRLRNVLSAALGHGGDGQVRVFDVAPGDKIILMSDGVHDNLKDTEIASAMEADSPPRLAAKNVTDAARARSRDARHSRAKDDDITALVVEITQ